MSETNLKGSITAKIGDVTHKKIGSFANVKDIATRIGKMMGKMLELIDIIFLRFCS